MRNALLVAVALHALLVFLPVGATHTRTENRTPVVRLRMRAPTTTQPPAHEPAPPARVATDPAAAEIPGAVATPPSATPRPPRTPAMMATAATGDSAATVTRDAVDSPTPAPTTSDRAHAPSIADTAARLGRLGTSPPGGPATVASVHFAAQAYANRVRAAIARHKRYPRRARRRGVEGVAIIVVAIDVRGELAAPPRLRRSSGAPDLDREALRMVRAAAPFDAPAGATATLTIELPVRFSVGQTAPPAPQR